MSDTGKQFDFVSIWNKCVEQPRERPIVPRSYLFASELGGSPIDLYLKLKGTIPTNPPNARSQRKFNSGFLTEWIVGTVLKRAGILIDSQETYRFQYPNQLMVSGRLDFVMGGRPDYTKAMDDISHMDFPVFVHDAMRDTIVYLKETFGSTELKKTVLEIKSTSSMMLDKYMRVGKPNGNHRLQAYHYLKASDYNEAHICYVCRDDLMCIEFPIHKPSAIEDEYKSFIELISGYHNAGQEPKKEDEVLFDKETLRFGANWKVEYSNFLTLLYGWERPDLYRLNWDKAISSWNRVYKRCVNGDKMTALNLSAIETAKKYFPNFDELVDIGKSHKELLTEEEVEA